MDFAAPRTARYTRARADRLVALVFALALLLLPTVACKDTGSDTNGNNANNNGGGGPSDAVDDAYDGVQDRAMSVGAPGVMGNDVDANGGTPATVTAIVAGATTQGGTVTLNTDGSFDYTPPAAFNGTDTFSYDYDDGDGFSDSATVTITVAATGTTWHVDNTAAPGGNGLSQPTAFDDIADAEAASAVGDTIIVHTGDGTTTNLTAGITLKNLQRIEANGTPLLGGAIVLANNVEVVGLALTGIAAPAIVGTGLDGRVTLDSITISACAGGVQISTSTGRLDIDQLSTTTLTGTALAGGSNSALSITVSNSSLATSNGAGIAADGGTTVTVSTTSIDATGSAALAIQDTTIDITLTALVSTNSTTNGIFLSSVGGSLTVSGAAVDINNATQNGIQMVGNSVVINFANGLDLDNGSAGGAVISTQTGNVTIAGTNINDTNGAGLVVTSAGTVAFSFGATSITATGVAAGTVGDALVLINNPTATVTFASLAVTTDNGDGVQIATSGTVNIQSTATTVSAATGIALDVSSTAGQTNGSAGWTFQTLTSTNSGTFGVTLASLTDDVAVTTITVSDCGASGIACTNLDGTVNLGSGSITSAASAAFDVDGGDGDISWAGTITNTAGRMIDVRNQGVTGSTSLTGSSMSDNGGTGISISNHSGDVTINNASVTNPAGTAVTISIANTVAMSTLVIDTTAGAQVGLFADVVGSLTIDTNSTVDGGTGTAVDLRNAALAATFLRISSNGAGNGISLDTTTGNFMVAGSGSQDTGGIIQNSTSDGISLNSAQGISLNWMTIQSPGQSGLLGAAVTDFTMANCRVLNAGNGGLTDAVNFASDTVNLFGVATFTNTTIDGDFRDGIHIIIQSGSLNIAMGGCTIRNSHGVNGRHGLHLETSDTAITDVSIDNATAFENLTQFGVRVTTALNAQSLVAISACTFQTTGGGIRLESSSTAVVNPATAGFTLASNSFTSMAEPALEILATGSGGFDGTFGGDQVAEGNTVTGSDDDGVRIRGDGTATTRVVSIRNNTIGCNVGQAIDVQTNNTSLINVTLRDNTATTSAAGSAAIRIVSEDSGSAICANLLDNAATGGAGGTGFDVSTVDPAIFGIERIGADPDAPAVVTHLQNENSPSTAAATGTGFRAIANGGCPVPTN